jgi:signal transduction histidine kinase
VVEEAFDRPTGERALVVAAPIAGAGGKQAGWLAAVLGLDAVAPGLAREYGGRQHFEFLVTDKASAPAWDGTRLDAFAEVPQFGWRVWAGVTTETALAPARAEVRRRLTLLGASLLAMVAMAAVVNRRIVRPVRGLGKAVAAADAGGAGRAPEVGPRELARLAAEFNAMIEHREKSEAKLADLNVRLQEALVQLGRSREDERRAIATALHDDAVQNLTAALWRLDDIADRGEDAEYRRRGLEGTRGAVESALNSMRHLLLELRPPALDQAGLAVALAQQLEGLGADTGMDVDLDDGLDDLQLPEVIETLAFRTVQEALRNVRKHARASKVTVRLRSIDGHLDVSVRDDGVGVDPAELERRASAGHLGVRSMRDYVQLAGGEFSIALDPAGGTEVRFSLPLSAVDVRA